MSYIENTLDMTKSDIKSFDDIALICVEEYDDTLAPTDPTADCELVLVGLTDRNDDCLLYNFGTECQELPDLLNALLKIRTTLSYRDALQETEFSSVEEFIYWLENDAEDVQDSCLENAYDALTEGR